MRVRKVTAFSLIAGAIVTMTPVGAAFVRAAGVTGGGCTSDVGSTTGVTMSRTAGGMCVLTFTNTGPNTWTVPADVTTAEVFLVGGGGAGGWSDIHAQGGGGGGGIAHKTGLAVAGTYTVNVGAGGMGSSDPSSPATYWTNGGNSSITDGTVTITADGGGYGAGYGGAVGANGGSGGGGHWRTSSNDKGLATKGSATGVTGVTFYGNDGGNSSMMRESGGGGGGGGATAPGGNGQGDASVFANRVGGTGGEGLTFDITGTAVVYGSGGGGIGEGGAGLGGTNAGDGVLVGHGEDAVPNTGGGGGAGGDYYRVPAPWVERGGHGGSGIVVIRFAPTAAMTTTTIATTTTSTVPVIMESATTTTVAPVLVVNVAAPPATAVRSATTPTSPAHASTTTIPGASTTTVPAVAQSSGPVAPTVGEVAPGGASAAIGGDESMPDISRAGNEFVVSTGGYTVKVAAVDAQNAVTPLSEEGSVHVPEGTRVRVNASGFEPFSTLEVWLFSTPMLLGQLKVPASGTVTATLDIPAGTPVGNHTLAVVRKGNDLESALIAVGLTYGDFAGDGVLGWLIALPILLAVLFAIFIPAAARRRRRSATAA